MKDTKILIAIVILIALGVVGFLAFSNPTEKPLRNNITIEKEYGNKIVYTTDTLLDTQSFRNHCLAEGGVFKECGSTCEPEADMCVEVCAYTCENIPATNQTATNSTDITGSVVTKDWKTYVLDEFNTTVRYPADDWNQHISSDSALSRSFSMYLKQPGVPMDLPLDHFANVTNVSIFPEGIPTEGLFGEAEPLMFDMNFQVADTSKVYVLEDGVPFAAYIQPEAPPTSWTDSGFIWVRVNVTDMQSRCERNGEPVDATNCDPLMMNDSIIRTGEVNTADWDIARTIAQNISLEPDQGEQDALIRLDTPQENAIIQSTQKVTGEARGPWYFEGSFPVILTDWDGKIIAETNAQAQGEWMTEEFVPFEATLSFESPYTSADPYFVKRGSLILQKSNPSGLPENDAAHEVSIRFAD